ncbi:hypothetical protein D3C80_1190820 [compost metagenome]
MAGGDNGQRRFTAQGAGVEKLLLIVVGNGLQQVLLLFAAGQTGLTLNDVTWTQKGNRADNGARRAVAFFDDLRCVPGVCHYSGIQKGQNIA